jgi:hypothetical protein
LAEVRACFGSRLPQNGAHLAHYETSWLNGIALLALSLAFSRGMDGGRRPAGFAKGPRLFGTRR